MADGVREPKTAAIAAEEAEGVDRLYRRYGSWLLRTLATRFRATAIEVDDLVQETFLRVARYPAEDAARHPQALLSRIAVNLARDQLRRNVVHGGLGETELKPFSDSAVEDDRHEQLVLKQVVLGLPQPLRDVFLLSRYTGQTYIEFPASLAVGEAPPLFLMDGKGTAQLVNYRLRGRFYIVDRIFDAAELRLGNKHQDVVRISRVADTVARRRGV